MTICCMFLGLEAIIRVNTNGDKMTSMHRNSSYHQVQPLPSWSQAWTYLQAVLEFRKGWKG